MAREPVDITAEPAPSHELHDMSRRFCVGVVLTLPVFILEMGRHIPRPRLGKLVPEQWCIWFQFALSTPVVFWVVWPFLQRGAASFRSGHLNILYADRARHRRILFSTALLQPSHQAYFRQDSARWAVRSAFTKRLR